MGTVTRHGRDFDFEDGVTPEQQEQRILNWMRQNAPDELRTAASPPAAPAQPASIPPTSNGGDDESTLTSAARFLTESPDQRKQPVRGNAGLRLLSTALLGPWGSTLSRLPGVSDAMGDVNLYRTLAQGALPVADEITAAVRSGSMGGPDYDTKLAEERQGVKDFGTRYGEIPKAAAEMTGALATIPLGIGAAGAAAKVIPGGAKLAALIAKHPFLASIATGATSGGATGFGAGEKDFGNRMDNAGANAVIGALLGPLAYAGVRGVDKATRWAGKDNRTADYFRTIIGREKKLDPNSSTFDHDAMMRLRSEMAEQQSLKTDPTTSDLLPKATEQLLLKPGRGTSELAESLYKRQYDETLPPSVALAQSQHGRVGDAFDQAFGPDIFKLSDEALIAQRKANAATGYAPAYARNVMTPEIADAMERMKRLNPKILSLAESWADTARPRRPPPFTKDPDGNIIDYNTQYLHDIKRSMEHVMGEERLGNPNFQDRYYLSAKTDLNKAVKDANDDYRKAMEQFGEDSGLIGALEKGRNEIFVPGSIDKTGAMDDAAITAYMSDPLIPQAQKDLFLIGGARSLREKVLANQSKKFTHNWADILSNPEHEKRIGALVNGRQLGGWDLFRARLNKESRNYKNATAASGNSRTAAREDMKAELESINPDAMAALALLISPKAPSGWRGIGSTIRQKIDPAIAMANKSAEILSRRGVAGNAASLDEIEKLLTDLTARNASYRNLGTYAPAVAGYTWPFKEE